MYETHISSFVISVPLMLCEAGAEIMLHSTFSDALFHKYHMLPACSYITL